MSTTIERLTEASRWKDGRGEPLESVFVPSADLSALLAWVEDARKGLKPFANEFTSGNEAFLDFVEVDEDNELHEADFRNAAALLAELAEK